MEKNKIWRFLKEKLSQNQKAVLISVLEARGGSPGKAGFKIAVAADELEGTVGGGVMEYDLINEARKTIAEGKVIREVRKLYHNKTTDKRQSGLICTGNQTICFYSLTETELPAIEKISALNGLQKPVTLIVSGSEFIAEDSISEGIKIQSKNKKDWRYTEEISAGEIIYICGGGHVGKAVAAAMKSIDFRIRVIDPRPAIIEGLTELADEEKILSPFEKTGGFIENGKNVYAVILTSSYLTDKAALKQILYKNIKYTGMMGSKAKIKKVYSELEAEGVDARLFEKVHAPVGLEINSLTPAEIAVSIAAQIIKVKNSEY